jgi:hypothetical protein
MPELSLRHIEQISNDISMQEITFSHLLHDLIDHVCCDVENEMQNGFEFSEAYRRVKQKMGFRRLKEIQEETLYLVDTKYRYMKNTMKITGIAGTVMLGFATLFKIMHWPGAAILMTLGALVLAFIFLPSSLGILWKETHSSRRLFLFISAFISGMFFIFGVLFKIQHWPASGIILSLATVVTLFFFIPALLVNKFREDENRSGRLVYIFGAAGIACYTLGLLFKIQHWPLSGELLMAGLFILFFIVYPWYTWQTWKNESTVSARFIFILIGSLAIILPGALINLSLQRTYDTGFYINQEQQQALYKLKYTNNQFFLKNSIDSTNIQVAEQIHLKTIEVLAIVNETEEKMVTEADANAGLTSPDSEQFKQTGTGMEIQYSMMKNPFDRASVRDHLRPECASRQKLEVAMKAYIGFLLSLPSGTELKQLKGLADPETYIPQMDKGVTLMSGLHSMMLLKNGLLTLELYALRSVAY